MRYILGMAKSPEDARGSKGRNLELDFLRLVHAVEHFRANGHAAQGYMLVLADAVRTRIHGWIEKYGAQDCVEIVVPPGLTEDQLRLLAEEKDRNRRGNFKGVDRTLANAAYGRELGEDCLKSYINTQELNVEELGPDEAPFGVQWDFFGVVRN